MSQRYDSRTTIFSPEGRLYQVEYAMEAIGLSSGKLGTIAYAIIQVPITLVGAILLDKTGRRPLIMISATGTFLGWFLTVVSFYFKGHGILLESVSILAVSGVLIFISAFSIGMGAVPWLIMSEAVFGFNKNQYSEILSMVEIGEILSQLVVHGCFPLDVSFCLLRRGRNRYY